MCGTAHAVHDGLADIAYVLLPLLAQSLGLTYAQAGALRASGKAAMALVQLPAGLAGERLSPALLLAFGTALAGVAFLALGRAEGFTAVAVALFAAGVGHAFQHPLASTLVSHAYPGTGRRTALGVYNFAGDLGKVLGAALVSVALAAGLDWQANATALGWIAIACALLLAATLAWRSAGTARDRPAPAPASADWGIRHRTGFRALCALGIGDNVARTAFLTVIGFVVLAKGLPEAWAAAAVALVAGGGMFGKLAFGLVAERVGVVRALACSLVLSTVLIGTMLVLPGPAALAVLPLAGMALNGASSVLYASIGDLVARDRVARAFGLFYTLGSASGVLAPIVFGLIADGVGVVRATWAIALVPLAGLALAPSLARALAEVARLTPESSTQETVR